MPVSKATILRSLCALGGAALITLLGLWAFSAWIHDDSQWLVVVQLLSMPFFALLRTADFFHSDFLAWASVFAGLLFWWSFIYVVIKAAGRRRIPT